jgi:hypothetical protein
MSSIGDVIRMAGHLIEARPTTDRHARDSNGEGCPATSSEAVCWCGSGALMACAKALGFRGGSGYSHDVYQTALGLIPNAGSICNVWDGASPEARLEIARAWQNYNGP